MENTNNENINDLLKQLAETQGEGEGLLMFDSPRFDESKVDESLFEKMENLYQKTKKKMGQWESKYDTETLQITSMQHDFNNGATFLKNMIDSFKVNNDLLTEMQELTNTINDESNKWSLDYSEDVVENTAIKHSQMID